jgi:hypothetical protein
VELGHEAPHPLSFRRPGQLGVAGAQP